MDKTNRTIWELKKMLENGKIELFLREEVTTMMEGLRAGKIGLH